MSGIALHVQKLDAQNLGAQMGAQMNEKNQLIVAAASDLNFVLKEIAPIFEQQHGGAHLRLVFGSSSTLATQAENGAPFDVFLSADTQLPDHLVASGVADRATVTRFAIGALVFVSPDSVSPDSVSPDFVSPEEATADRATADRVAATGVAGHDDGAAPERTDDFSRRLAACAHVAIANPAHAPYGRAAAAALRAMGAYDAVKPKLVLGENAAQAAQFVETGAADCGILPLSLTRAQPSALRSRALAIPQKLFPPVVQSGVALKRSRNAALAADFLRFLRSPQAAAIFRQHGYLIPQEKKEDQKDGRKDASR